MTGMDVASHGHAADVRSKQHPILNITRRFVVNTKLATPCCEAFPLSEHHNDRITTKNLFAF